MDKAVTKACVEHKLEVCVGVVTNEKTFGPGKNRSDSVV